MSASLAVQKAIRSRLVSNAFVISLVPAGNILDRNATPAPDPSIILGEDQEVDENRIDRSVVTVFSTLHIWKKETGLTGAKAIAGAVKRAVRTIPMQHLDGYFIVGCYVSSTRFLRDPGGEYSHGVVTVESFAKENA